YVLQHTQGTQRDVLEVADRRGDQVKSGPGIEWGPRGVRVRSHSGRIALSIRHFGHWRFSREAERWPQIDATRDVTLKSSQSERASQAVPARGPCVIRTAEFHAHLRVSVQKVQTSL